MHVRGNGPVIMVDDNEFDFMIAKMYYQKTGLAGPFMHLESGEQLVQYLHQVREGSKPMPALVLLDINMPGMSGFETVQAVRSLTDFRDVPWIMMLTTSSRDKDRDLALEAGADGFFIKPLDGSGYRALFDGLQV